MHRKHDVQAFSKHRQKHRRAMFLSEHRLNIPSLRNGKHPIVKNIPSLRNVKIPQPYLLMFQNIRNFLWCVFRQKIPFSFLRLTKVTLGCSAFLPDSKRFCIAGLFACLHNSRRAPFYNNQSFFPTTIFSAH